MQTAYSHLTRLPFTRGKIQVTVPREVLCELGCADSHANCLELMARLAHSLDTLVRLRKPRGELLVTAADLPALRLMAASDGLIVPHRRWTDLPGDTQRAAL
ncbi:MAG: hypothetical protein EOO29_12995 [Comamonadaceae bacterium]|nr:MAG: hypothetical protein EOO29_12995 [Comamonadaceae bacterium]